MPLAFKTQQLRSAPGVFVALAGCYAFSIAPLAAQTPGTDTPAVDRLEEVVVTGSLLKRAVGDVAQPLTTLTAEDLVAAGATNPEQILREIPQNQALSVSNTNLASNTGGGSYANLRALGSARTLVLLNGKRVVNNPFQTIGVDLNTVPMALVERVEVLTDGGSATYGTDATAGVVNFITSKEITGLKISGTASTPEASGGGQTYLASVSGGLGSLAGDGWNVYAGATWRKAEELLQSRRDFSRTTFIPERGVNRLNGTTFPANYSQPASGINGVNPTSPDCAPPFSLHGDGLFGPRSCGYDQLAVANIVTPQEQWSVLGKGSLQLGERHTVSLEYVRAENEVLSAVSPQGVSNLTMTSANPFFPGQGITPGVAGLNPALPVIFNLRTEHLGRRESIFDGSTDRALAQLEGELAGWDYQLSALASSSEVSVIFTNGYPDELRLRDGLTGANGAPFLNPFGAQTEAGARYLQEIELLGEAQSAESDLELYSLQLNRDLFRLPAGPVALAVAFEYKDDSAAFFSNLAISSRTPSSFVNTVDIAGSRHAMSAAVETSIPVLNSLDVGLSVRYDDYSDFGDTTNPEFSVRYQPIDTLTFRASASTGFRAPTLYDVFQPTTLSFTNARFNDPVLCPGGVVNAAAGGIQIRDCQITFPRLIGGSRSLDAEESVAFSGGVIFTPLRGLSFGVDYWEYEVQQSLGPLADQAVFADPVKYADLLVRCSDVPAEELSRYRGCLVSGGDPIAYVDNRVQNQGDTRTSGFDGSVEWALPEAGSLGQFGIRYRGTYVQEYEFQREVGGPFFSRAGRYFDTFPVIRYLHFLTFSWERGSLSTSLTNRYTGGYTDCNAQCLIAPEFFNEVDANSLWDLSATYRGSPHLTISASITNLLDDDPPFTNKNSGLSSAYDARFADARLRSYLLTLTYEF